MQDVMETDNETAIETATGSANESANESVVKNAMEDGMETGVQSDTGGGMPVEEIVVGPAQVPQDNPLFNRLQTGAARPSCADGDAAYRQLYRYAEDMRNLVKERAWAMAELQLARRETLYRLAVMAEFNTELGPAPMMRIGIMSALVATVIGMSEDYCDVLCIAAPLRDIGKVGVFRLADDLARGHHASTDPMREHTVIGAAILGGSISEELQMAEEVALSHHERYDGRGYPYGLEGTAIPLSGRIVAVVERFDELMSQWDKLDDALKQVRQQAGTTFDPRVVEALAQCKARYPRTVELVASRLAQSGSLGFSELLPGLWRSLASDDGPLRPQPSTPA